MSRGGERTTKHPPKCCKQCGAQYLKLSKLSRKQWDEKEYCSNRCGNIAKRKPRQTNGYWLVWDGDRKRNRSHVVMESKLGRPLREGEVVDHINGDEGDDRPENLRVFASHAEHMAAHWAEGTITRRPGLGGTLRRRSSGPNGQAVAA